MNYNIVPMTADHLDEIVELEQRCFADPWSRRMLVDQLENACAATIVAQGEDGTILGYASLLAVLDEGYINNIAVRPEYRRQGVASQLLDVFLFSLKVIYLTIEGFFLLLKSVLLTLNFITTFTQVSIGFGAKLMYFILRFNNKLTLFGFGIFHSVA